ncbi:MAG: fatty acid--CoA ligase [Pseudomonadota bacterium]
MPTNEESYFVLRSLADIPRMHAANTPKAVAISFEGRETSYSDLQDKSTRVANGLRAAGIKAGDRIAVLDKNSDRFFEIWLGAAKLNAVIVPINARLAGPEIEYVLNDAHIRVLFIGDLFVDLIKKIGPQLQTVERVIVINEQYVEWRDQQSNEDKRVESNDDDVCLQLYTSGTTGHPKGVQLTNRNVLGSLPQTLKSWGEWSARDIALVAMPLFHIAGCGTGLICLLGGLRFVLVRDFVPADIIKLIERERVSVTFLVPAMILGLLNDPAIKNANLSSLRRIVYGASPIPLELLKKAVATFKAAGFVQIYGLTETTGGVTVLTIEDHVNADAQRLRSCGKPIEGVTIQIRDIDGQVAPVGEVGEIVCRTIKNMKGYWNRDLDTKRAIRDGWFYTGDAGYLNEHGYLFIHDRVKDMIVSGGENIYPAEIESALYGHEEIVDIAVIGVPDEKWGEAVKAIIVRKPGSKISADEILTFARERLAGYKLPKSIDFVDVLPRNPTGKILKRELREKYWRGYERRVN